MSQTDSYREKRQAVASAVASIAAPTMRKAYKSTAFLKNELPEQRNSVSRPTRGTQ